jgi:hypothetical protein
MIDLSRLSTQPVETASLPKSQGRPSDSLGIGIIIGALLTTFSIWLFGGFNVGPHKDGNERQERQHSSSSLQGGTIVFVADTKNPPVWQTIFVRDMKEWAERHGHAGFTWLDDNDDPNAAKLIEAAKAKGVDPPLVAYAKDKKIIRIAGPWTDDKANLEKILK